uniref:Uncharacterized protein n=1 Tax=Panagrolaimus sp. PS1159 TaxID=55785 RepID=A0AC35FFU8_9BILA
MLVKNVLLVQSLCDENGGNCVFNCNTVITTPAATAATAALETTTMPLLLLLQ